MRRPLKAVSSIALVAVLAVTAAACGSSSKKASTNTDTGGSVTAADCPVQALTNYDASKGRIKVPLWYSLDRGEQESAHRDGRVVQQEPEQGHRGAATRRASPTTRCWPSTSRASPRSSSPPAPTSRTARCRPWSTARPWCPAESCMEAAGLRLATMYPSRRCANYYTVHDVFWPAYANVSTPILYYNKAPLQEGRPRPEQAAADARRDPQPTAKTLKEAGVSKPPSRSTSTRGSSRSGSNGAGGDRREQRQRPRPRRATAATFDNAQLKQMFTTSRSACRPTASSTFPNTRGHINQYLASPSSSRR